MSIEFKENTNVNAFILAELLIAIIIASILIGGALLGLRQAIKLDELTIKKTVFLNNCQAYLNGNNNVLDGTYSSRMITNIEEIHISIDGKYVSNNESMKNLFLTKKSCVLKENPASMYLETFVYE